MPSLSKIASKISDLLESEDLDHLAAAFLAIVPPERLEKTQKALWGVLTSYKEGAIFNTDFQNWKTIVDRSFEEAYDNLVSPPGYYWEPAANGEWKPTPTSDWDSKKKSLKGEVADIIGSFASGVRSSISISKKLAKVKIKDPHVDAVRALLNAAVPIALIFEKIKPMIVKGKKPLSPEKQAIKQAQLAKKNVQTCACCFRAIATLPNGLIADHGYTLPHPGSKSASCPGGKFRPLEVSDDGLKYMVKQYEAWVSEDQKALERAPSLTKLHKASYSSKLGVEVQKGEPEWDKVYKNHVTDLERDLQRDQDQLKMYRMKLSSWKPQLAESLKELTTSLKQLTD